MTPRKTSSPEVNIAYKMFQMYPCTFRRKLNAFKENVIRLRTDGTQPYTIDEIKKMHFTSNPYMCEIIEGGIIFFCDLK